MHFRISTKKTDSKTYHYGQIVESYRRKNGVPGHRVLRSLGRLPRPLLDLISLAFKAFNKNQALVLNSEVAELLSGSTLANVRSSPPSGSTNLPTINTYDPR